MSALPRDNSGIAVVEFAFVATIMIFMYLGSTQLSDAINANRRITITARALADLASRTPSDVGSRIGELKESQLSTIIAASGQVLHPYDLENAQIRISEVWKCAVPRNRASNTTYDPAHADPGGSAWPRPPVRRVRLRTFPLRERSAQRTLRGCGGRVEHQVGEHDRVPRLDIEVLADGLVV